MFNENFNDGQSMISQEIQQRNPQQIIFQQQQVKTVDLNQVLQEYASNPCEIYKFYLQQNKDLPQKTLISQVESLIVSFSNQNKLSQIGLLEQQIQDTQLNIKQFQNLLKFTLNKDNETSLGLLCTLSPLVKEYVSVVCDAEFIQYKLDQLQQKLDLLLEQKSQGLKHFIISKPTHQKEFEDWMDCLVSCKTRAKIAKRKNQQQFEFQPQQSQVQQTQIQQSQI